MMRKTDWLIPIGLTLLGVIPFVAGVLRIVELGGDPVNAPQNARFFDDPLPSFRLPVNGCKARVARAGHPAAI